jgi:transcriptional regulator with XRE-family HTH domain
MIKNRDFGAYLERRLVRDPALRSAVEREVLNGQVASLILDAREAAGLTQQQLAELIGSRQSVIARLEDADYRGHSLSMLAKIAQALNRRVCVTLEPLKKTAKKRRPAKAKPRRKKAS